MPSFDFGIPLDDNVPNVENELVTRIEGRGEDVHGSSAREDNVLEKEHNVPEGELNMPEGDHNVPKGEHNFLKGEHNVP